MSVVYFEYVIYFTILLLKLLLVLLIFLAALMQVSEEWTKLEAFGYQLFVKLLVHRHANLDEVRWIIHVR